MTGATNGAIRKLFRQTSAKEHLPLHCNDIPSKILYSSVFSGVVHIILHLDLSDGSKHVHHILNLNRQFTDSKVREISLKVLRDNAFFAHVENIIIAL